MICNHLTAEHFRNLSRLELEASDRINVIYGDNAQGKTNLIEAIWMFSGNKSFRGAHEKELIQLSQSLSHLNLTFSDSRRQQEAELWFGEKKDRKKAFLNGVPLEGASALSGEFRCVVFSPAYLSLVKDGPGVRRRFLDAAICQLNSRYRNYLLQYEKALTQRNALLKDSQRFGDLRDLLDVWDLQLSKLGTILTIFRQDYVTRLGKAAREFYAGFANGKEEILETGYSSTIYPQGERLSSYEDSSINRYYQALKESYGQDSKMGATTVGIHRDDLTLSLNGLDCRTYGSQGQQRSCVLALKLSEAQLLKEVTGENPVILLDDVMSELDAARQDYILNHVKQFQVFLTCCDAANLLRLTGGRVFHIKEGSLEKETDT